MRPPIAGLVTFVCMALSVSLGIAGDPEGAVSLDGVSVLVNSSSGYETSSMPVLKSDVELIARLLLVEAHGQGWTRRKLDGATRFKARRLATLTRLLAHVAARDGEKVKPADRDEAMRTLEAKAGGSGAMGGLLNQCGASRNDFEYWVTNFMLAKIQLNYLADQVDPPGQLELKEMFKQGEHRFGDASYNDVKDEYRELVMDRKIREALRDWVSSVLVHGKVIFSK